MLKENTSVRLMFYTRLGVYWSPEEPFILEDARLPDRFRKLLAMLAVDEISTVLFTIHTARESALPYDYGPSVDKLVSIENDNLLGKDTYEFASLCRTKMKALVAQYMDTGLINKLETAIIAGRTGVKIYRSSPYEYAAISNELCQCLYLYVILRKDDTILNEIKSLCLDTIAFYENEPLEFDFTPFEGRRPKALLYVLSRNLGSKTPSEDAGSMLAQVTTLKGILNWDLTDVREGATAMKQNPPRHFENGLTLLEASIHLQDCHTMKS